MPDLAVTSEDGEGIVGMMSKLSRSNLVCPLLIHDYFVSLYDRRWAGENIFTSMSIHQRTDCT